MSYSLVAHVATGAGTGGGTYDTSAALRNTSGADLITVVLTSYEGSAPALSDSKLNTYAGRTARVISGDSRCQIFYIQGGVVGSGHYWTVTGLNYSSICVQAWSGSLVSPYDTENGATTGVAASTLATGSVTPAAANELVLAGWSYANAATPSSVDNGFTILDQVANVSGDRWGAVAAYLIQGSAAAVNPAVTLSGTSLMAGAVASFKAAAGGTLIVKIPRPVQAVRRASWY